MNHNSAKCAACGAEGDGLKACTACNLVKYCNVACQKQHRPHHKDECRKMFDEALFRERPKEECPICCIPMPIEDLSDVVYKTCCGKMLCRGCVVGVAHTCVEGVLSGRKSFEAGLAEDVCPYCRSAKPRSDKEEIERLMKRMGCGDGAAFSNLGYHYQHGTGGLPQDERKAIELFVQAGKRGFPAGYANAARAYYFGMGVQTSKKKAKYYFELAMMNGDIDSSSKLAILHGEAGNDRRALKHLIFAAEAGHKNAMSLLRPFYSDGDITKDEYTKILLAHQNSIQEMKSDARDRSDGFRKMFEDMGLPDMGV